MMHYPEPSFLSDTFLWQRGGYQLSGPVPEELRSPATLASPNPWLRLAAILEKAKRGEFQDTRLLRESLDADLSPFFRDAYAELLGDAGPGKTLNTLAPLFLHDADTIRLAACRAAYWSGYLFLVPLMLEAWRAVKSSDARDTISFMLSDLLEPTTGPVVMSELFLPDEYSQLVRKLLATLLDKLGNDRVPVWEGGAFGVVKLAEHMHDSIHAPKAKLSELEVDFLTFRHKLESSTGLDCSPFYQDEEFRPLSASAIIEDFLESDAAGKYQDGIRYFFGHRIPD